MGEWSGEETLYCVNNQQEAKRLCCKKQKSTKKHTICDLNRCIQELGMVDIRYSWVEVECEVVEVSGLVLLRLVLQLCGCCGCSWGLNQDVCCGIAVLLHIGML